MDREALERDLSSRRKALLRHLLKCTSVDRKSTDEPRNFPRVPGVITLIRNTRGNLKVWEHLAGAKDVFPKLRMAQIVSSELKRLAQFCSGRSPVLLHISLH